MRDFKIRKAQKEDYPRLASWLVEVGQTPQTQCLHTWSGQDANELYWGLLSMWEAGELIYLLALRGDELKGAFGSEFDDELARAWLYGPHVKMRDWESTAGELYTRLMAELPAHIRQWEAYLNIENQRGRRFYAQRGFEEMTVLNFDYELKPGDRILTGERGAKPLQAGQAESFKRLYTDLFPKAYYSAERMVAMLGVSHWAWVIDDSDEVLGFAIANLEEGQPSAEIQFLGVRQDSRKQGYGRRLLLTAIDWLLEVAGVERISLNVNQELAQARALYESAGFRLRFTGIGLQKRG